MTSNKTIRVCNSWIFALVLFYYFSFDGNAQNVLPVSIDSDTVLTDTSTYYTCASTFVVQLGVTLTIEKGVEIRFPASSGLTVHGTLIINGTENDPVEFTSLNDTIRWSYITASNATINLNYLIISKAIRFLNINGGSVYLNHCYVEDTYGGIGADCIGAHDASEITVEYCEFHGNPAMSRIDCIDCDQISNGTFQYNSFYDFEDEGIDIGTNSSNILIEHNYMENCNFGVSIGENSNADVIRNIMVACDGAIQSHNGAHVQASNNTFFKNQIGLQCHHGGDANSAGSLDLKNTVFAETVGGLTDLQATSVLNISYSITDKDTLPGNNNLIGDPRMVNPDSGDFSLFNYSPCINHGDPSDTTDTCGTPIDIGAIEYNCSDTSINALNEFNQRFGEILIYPNPSSGEIRIKSLNSAINYPCTINIYTLDGRKIDTWVLDSQDEPIYLEGLSGKLFIIELVEINSKQQKKYYSKLILK